MTYELLFDVLALREWHKLAPAIKDQLRKKLAARLEAPKVEADKLAGMPGCYKIKLSSLGYRLVYRVVDDQVQVVVIAVGKRERGKVYKAARERIADKRAEAEK